MSEPSIEKIMPVMYKYPLEITYKDHTVLRKTGAENLIPETLNSIICQAFLIQNAFMTKHVFWKKNKEDIQRPLKILEDFLDLKENHNSSFGSHIYIVDEIPDIGLSMEVEKDVMVVQKSRIQDIIQSLQQLDDTVLHARRGLMEARETTRYHKFTVKRTKDDDIEIVIPSTNKELTSFFSDITSEKQLTDFVKDVKEHSHCPKPKTSPDPSASHKKPGHKEEHKTSGKKYIH
ncbi:hypothetical protein NCAS_0I02340 [Naumovozyma castellii]|uniref:Uncharacterized protein n=1 Tax=Naumovozyma castellii TaxID=27288 RepID=G0VK68_NAUCA|nr:hypothetical protein NCAS_0I02340 [Naumovozyma castellii CBS 4309]CCC71902.1 hypothetical protein NCAS_0I02340 [Naumovozyma castellii CBS 4309]